MRKFASVYAQGDTVNDEAAQYIHHYAESLAPVERHGELRKVTIASLSASEREQLANSFAANITHVEELRDLLSSLDRLYSSSQEQH